MLLTILPLFSGLAADVENRFILVDQSDWGAHRGFYIDIENKGPDGSPRPIHDARLILGVADGKDWRYIAGSGLLEAGRTYAVEADISPTDARLTLDGKTVGSADGAFVPFSKPLTVADRPGWASAATAYRLEPGPVRISSGDQSQTIAPPPSQTGALAFFGTPLAVQTPFAVPAAARIRITASFRVVASSPADLVGLVDPYGQAVAANWPEKVRSDADLVLSQSVEAQKSASWRRPGDWDAYGGLKTAPWHENAAGFYRVVKRDGVWWLVSPNGNPLFYTGLCTAPAVKWEMTPVDGRESLFQAMPPKIGATAGLWQNSSPWGDGPANYFAPQAWNLTRKFGADWEKQTVAEFERRLDAWAFSGQGKWADQISSLPRTLVLVLGVPRLVRHPDVFDDAVKTEIRGAFERQLGPLLKDPNVVGYTIGSEFDEIVTTDEVRTILKDHADSASAKAIRSAIGANPTSDDATIERARRFYADAYYGLLYRTGKEVDPNHLYLGNWIVPGWWQNEADWDLIAAHCDVIGYDFYSHAYQNGQYLVTKFDKPTFVGEFSFPSWYEGSRGYGRFEASFVQSDADAGKAYAEWLAAASRDPRCVGVDWFQYRDEPLTGRGPGKGNQTALGENYAFGFVDVADQPKWDLVTRAREANLRATSDRLSVVGGGVGTRTQGQAVKSRLLYR